uniref:CRAL-TRIO domain-containing protein n=1 Tax=Chromera velia CCMP2878 TaxID=1169474 RepID=A0A0G4HUT2_9ALVE|eukprot:Cvel_8723.t1-p1 / transcript=Cvel_8723.t1 / gene=Cvel_8723 / organism=Chromera_velia_CCMP2878 / gene_product=hypothetical protein / transcript_product=hypothetical protein / location=Cvel_scaffold487:59562-63862(+) / protein_length=134 / sequence_SO=supercontig / SO=protein_coding / is_pseudo=false
MVSGLLVAETLIINAPGIFTWAFGVISSWLDERTRSKVAILDPKILPTELGGETELRGWLSFPGTDSGETKLRGGKEEKEKEKTGPLREGVAELGGDTPKTVLLGGSSSNIECALKGSEMDSIFGSEKEELQGA